MSFKSRRWPISFALLLVAGLAVVGFQNCDGGFSSLSLSSSASRLSGITAPISGLSVGTSGQFSDGYTGPASKQGSFESRIDMPEDKLDQRYVKLSSMGAGYRQYNFSWEVLEHPEIASSATPITCPAEFTLIPANEQERVGAGFHRFRCFNTYVLTLFDRMLRRDQKYGIQSGAVFYFIPKHYREPGCEGFNFAGNIIKGGCAPRENAMNDFEDYINFAAYRYNGRTDGKLSHFIIWNENNNANWFDYSPFVARNDFSAAANNKRIDKYVSMLKTAANAITRHQKKAMMYVSTDQHWEANAGALDMGARTLLDGIWARLGTTVSWSVAVHPYGTAEHAAPGGLYTFNNLELVANYQVEKLRALGIANPLEKPQSFLLASEQGWDTAADHGRAGQARQMCIAHEKAVSMPQLIATAHNYFHSVESTESSGGSSVQGAFFGLLPYELKNTLEGIEDIPTGQAFISTMNPNLYGQSGDHFCCRVYGRGCPGGSRSLTAPPVTEAQAIVGNVDGIATVGGQQKLIGWACTRGSEASISVHLYADGPAGSGRTVGAYMADQGSEPQVAAACAVAGLKGHRFAIPIDATMLDQFGGASLFVHGISTVGLTNDLLQQSGKYRLPSAPDVVPIYRHYLAATGEHFYSANKDEAAQVGFVFESTAFKLSANQVANTQALYRCNSGKHFMSVSPTCEGVTNEGRIGYIWTTSGSGRVPLYRRYQPKTGDHIYTLNADEGTASGYYTENVTGYVRP